APPRRWRGGRRPVGRLAEPGIVERFATVSSIVPEGATRLTVVGAPQIATRKPAWLKHDVPLAGPTYRELKRVMRGLSLNTVCEQAASPNIHECWADREASFLIGGNQCTRRCGFCQ